MVGLFANQMDFELLGIGTVLKRNRLAVPLNQREYSWIERNVQELFQDLSEAMSSGKQAYFLGVIVLTSGDEDKFEIADGQQRLATTTILLAAIRDYFYNKKDDNMVNYLQDFLQTFVLETREHNPRLHLNVADHDYFRRRVLELPDQLDRLDVTAMQPSHKLLERAAELAAEHVKNVLSPLSEVAQDTYLPSWIKFLENSAQVITLKVPDDMNAYLMFETLNDRGLRVSQSDLVKNYLFSEAPSRLSEAQDRWSSMNTSLDSLDDEDSAINFLRHLLISLYGPVRERDVLERVRGRVRSPAPAIQFLDTLSAAAGDYVALQTPGHIKWSSYGVRLNRVLEELLLLRVTPLRPLMLSVIRNFSQEESEQAMRRFVSWSVRWLTAGGARSGTVENAIGIAAKRVTGKEIDSSDSLSSSMNSVLPSDSTFELAFSNFSVANHKIARYYLRSLESAYHSEPEPEWIPNVDTVITLEHVLPQNPGINWPGIEAAIHSTYYRRLGNMTLLKGSLNSNIGNDPFIEKLKVFGSSEYELTMEITAEQTWGPAEIEKRQARLSKLAVKAWPLD